MTGQKIDRPKCYVAKYPPIHFIQLKIKKLISCCHYQQIKLMLRRQYLFGGKLNLYNSNIQHKGQETVKVCLNVYGSTYSTLFWSPGLCPCKLFNYICINILCTSMAEINFIRFDKLIHLVLQEQQDPSSARYPEYYIERLSKLSRVSISSCQSCCQYQKHKKSNQTKISLI